MRKLFLLVALAAVRAGAQQPATNPPAQPASSPLPAAITENASCLKCHEPIVALLKKKAVHPAVEMGCASCHVDHPSGAKSETLHYLNSAQPDLCSTCHDLKDKALSTAHRGQPYEKATCTGCHNPHGSDRPKLIASREHPPFTGRQCGKCHQDPLDGKVQLTVTSVNGLCQGCHTQFKARYDKSKVKHGFIEMDENSCISCHRPHASERPKLLKAKTATLCSGCHEDKPGNKKFVHEPAAANCTICHDPHSSDYAVRLKADVNTICTACHTLRPPTQNSQGELLIMPEGFPERATKIPLDRQNNGHPYVGHPVSGTSGRGDNSKPLTCVSCHNPHSGSVVQRFVGDLKGNALCLSCHGKK